MYKLCCFWPFFPRIHLRKMHSYNFWESARFQLSVNLSESPAPTNVLFLPIKHVYKITEKQFEQTSNYGSATTKTLLLLLVASLTLIAIAVGPEALSRNSHCLHVLLCFWTIFLCCHWDQNNDGGSSIKDAPHQPRLPNATTALTLLYSPLSAFLLWKHLQGHLSMRPLPDESAADCGQTLARRKQWARIEKSRRGHLSGWERLFLCPDAAIETGGEPFPGTKQQIDWCPDQNEDIIWSGARRERNMDRSFYSFSF